MPRKKNINKKKASILNLIPNLNLEESYVSLAIGLIVVVIIVALGVIFVKNQKKQDTSSLEFKPDIESQLSPKPGEKGARNYTIKQGDTLWKISEDFFKSGYNWVDIASANKLPNPDVISAGTKLVIPDVKSKEITVLAEKSGEKPSISGNSYRVQQNDNLWEISVRAYGDGYSWVKIAKENKLTNPDLIFSGNVLKIPR